MTIFFAGLGIAPVITVVAGVACLVAVVVRRGQPGIAVPETVGVELRTAA